MSIQLLCGAIAPNPPPKEESTVKVTVMSPAVAAAKGFLPPTPALFPDGAYAVAAPDGLFYYPSLDSASAFAQSYVDAGLVAGFGIL